MKFKIGYLQITKGEKVMKYTANEDAISKRYSII